MGKFKSKELIRSSKPPLLFFRPLLRRLFPRQEWENIYFSLSLSKHVYLLAYGTTAFFYAVSTVPSLMTALSDAPSIHDWSPLFAVGAVIIAISLIVDFSART